MRRRHVLCCVGVVLLKLLPGLLPGERRRCNLVFELLAGHVLERLDKQLVCIVWCRLLPSVERGIALRGLPFRHLLSHTWGDHMHELRCRRRLSRRGQRVHRLQCRLVRWLRGLERVCVVWGGLLLCDSKRDRVQPLRRRHVLVGLQRAQLHQLCCWDLLSRGSGPMCGLCSRVIRGVDRDNSVHPLWGGHIRHSRWSVLVWSLSRRRFFLGERLFLHQLWRGAVPECTIVVELCKLPSRVLLRWRCKFLHGLRHWQLPGEYQRVVVFWVRCRDLHGHCWRDELCVLSSGIVRRRHLVKRVRELSSGHLLVGSRDGCHFVWQLHRGNLLICRGHGLHELRWGLLLCSRGFYLSWLWKRSLLVSGLHCVHKLRGWLFPGLAFFIDYLRISVLILILIFADVERCYVLILPRGAVSGSCTLR